MSRLAPLPAIATPRLKILPLELRDAAALRAVSDHPSVTRAIHFLRSPVTLAQARALARGEVHGVDRFYGLWRRGALVGVIGLGARHRALEVGYWLAHAQQGRGLAREALRAFLSGIERTFPGRPVIAECRPQNRRSWRLLTRLGFAHSDAGQRPGRALLTRIKSTR